uniref:Protein kinase domain-containing protein n=1 Tax=Steinernema glaseri TaxID=37863 RepID=A0A1I7ZAM2_9BILA
MMSIDQVKITDFGLARICEGIDPLFANDAGTASYLPPEVYR